MPKNWSHHEAEIRRLYMEEGKPLKQVRHLMIAEHRFEASIRAYRMKLDEWGLKKNYLSKDRRTGKHSPNESDISKISVLSESLSKNDGACSTTVSNVDPRAQSLFNSLFGIDIPDGPHDPVELLSRVPKVAGSYGLDILLITWQSDSGYLEAAQRYLLDKHRFFSIDFDTHAGGNFFQLIEEKVSVNEQLPLARACLEADLERRFTGSLRMDPKAFWATACNAQKWNDSKRILYQGCCESPKPWGKLFLECAMIVIAEFHLKGHKDRFEKFSVSMDSLDVAEFGVVKTKLKDYIAILSDFNDTRLDVDPLWYKYLIQIAKWNETIATREEAELRKRLKDAEEYRDMYARLHDLYPTRGESIETQVDSLICMAKSEAKAILNWRDASLLCVGIEAARYPLHPDEGIDDDGSSSPLQSTSSSRDVTRQEIELRRVRLLGGPEIALGHLERSWRSGVSITDDIDTLLEDKSCQISVFDPSPSCAKNLFELIHQLIPINDRIPFISNILCDLKRFADTHYDCEMPNLAWWCLLYSSTTWQGFQETLGLQPAGLNEIMSPGGLQLVLTCTTLLVGKSILKELRSAIEYGHALKSGEHVGGNYSPVFLRYYQSGFRNSKYDEFRREYIYILQAFQDRQLEIDQPSFMFMMEMLQWGVDERRKEVEPSKLKSLPSHKM
ncbi:hypothetical protein BKA64DRAFT_684716, partial [Cadophora sp. MPI-SDFR-AT-0126]